jgi:nitrite reductase (cytochrome c-552)
VKERIGLVWALLMALLGVSVVLAACVAPAPTTPKLQGVPDTYDPAVWGKTYPVEYADWRKTKNERPTGLSKYKRGGTGGKEFDKLSEYPYMSALTSGTGFSVEYNEPRGHWWMLVDQANIDPSRLKAGGVCLTCKTPYANLLRAQEGTSYYSMPYEQAVTKLPKKDRYLGVTCVNCHDNKTMKLRPELFIVPPALKAMGMTRPTRSETRTLVCGQCHSTYVIPKQGGKSVDVVMPWAGSTPGSITVENIIAYIRSNEPRSLEWTQGVTGFKLGFIRHPEYELFTRGSPHWRNGLTCPDCHMPFKVEDDAKVTDHKVADPLDDPELSACRPCHPGSPDVLRQTVYDIQDRSVGLILLAGFSVAQDARLFQVLNSSPASRSVDASTYAAAKDAYEEAFYRSAFLTAENSVGFHNPTEVGRIAGDGVAFAQRAEGLLRQMLGSIGAPQPPEVDMQLRRYLTDRGARHASFDPALEFRDPFGITERLFAANLAALRSGAPFSQTPPPPSPGTTGAGGTGSAPATVSPGATSTP